MELAIASEQIQHQKREKKKREEELLIANAQLLF